MPGSAESNLEEESVECSPKRTYLKGGCHVSDAGGDATRSEDYRSFYEHAEFGV